MNTLSSNLSLTMDDFTKVDMRVGTVIKAKTLKEAKSPAYKMEINFGELGVKITSAQLTALYNSQDVIGRQVIAVVNFPPKQIANMMSECLIIGALGEEQEVILIAPEFKVANGLKMG